jgi:23S rRNA (adenine2030-N6)-methyltransferase
LNYRHSYHAGNFADVFKHIILVALIEAMHRKDSAYCFLDTHAGIGYYDLQAATTQKSKEYTNGILKILAQPNPPALIKAYLACVKAVNPQGIAPLTVYPGSPAIVKQLLRPQDRMVLTELHTEDYQLLKRAFPHDKQIGIHHQDGYLGLKAFLPPKERRGFVLIDPPYEQQNELTNLIPTLAAAVERWETGIFALWYPIKEHRSIERFQRALKLKISRPLLMTELSIYPDNAATALNGCGVIIVNPPWQLDEEIQAVLPWLWETLSPNNQGRYQLSFL